MSYFRIPGVILCLLAWASGPVVRASDVDLLVYEESGELSLYNTSAFDVDVAGYEFLSGANGLLHAGWLPISGRLDASGDMSFDATADWIVLSTPGSSSELSEAAFTGSGGTLTAGEILSLGLAWDTLAVQDLTASLLISDLVTPADVVFSPTGDYDRDGDVDSDDYTVFRTTYGEIIDLRADGNGDGVVDSADYTVWRDALTPPASALPVALMAFVVQVPEPSTLVLLALLSLAGVVRAPRRR